MMKAFDSFSVLRSVINPFNIFHRLVRPARAALSAVSQQHLRVAERQIVMQAQSLSAVNRARARLPGLYAAEFSAFSQFGEDGIIDFLVNRLPGISRRFVEFGVQDYRESNTRLLLEMRNWRGLVFDGAAANIAAIREQDLYWRHELAAEAAFVEKDNIDELLEKHGYTGDIGLLSVDIDGNDYWVWKAVTVVNPAIVVCEFNAGFGDRHAVTIPYEAKFERTAAHFSNLYFGASIGALVNLATQKGYVFVGTTSTGCNAFFIRNDLASVIIEALDAVWAFPSSVREARGPDGQLTFESRAAGLARIDKLPLTDIVSGGATTLRALLPVASAAWLGGEGIKWGVSDR